jgi:SAM-dependent methyltransferase
MNHADAVRRRDKCRLCDAPSLSLGMRLAPTPLANSLVAAADLDRAEPRFPLDVYVCDGCGHAQLLDIVDPSMMFGHYLYVSGTSPIFVRHLEQYARDLVRDFGLQPGAFVLEIGSNDGTLLRAFQQLGMTVTGVDPASNIAAQANADGIPTLNDFFTADLASTIRGRHGPAQAIVANNVLAHIDDLSGVMAGIRTLLAPDGVLAFEVSYLVDVCERTLFDTIYHEHVSYHAVTPLIGFLERHGLELFDVWRVDSQGGSIRVFAQPQGGPQARRPAVDELVALEKQVLGTRPIEGVKRLEHEVARLREELTALLRELRAAGKSIAGYGAPAKATTLMHHFGLDADALDFIVEDNPMKQGLYTPGLHVPIVESDALYARRPDYALVLAWNFADSIIQHHHRYTEEGGRFIVPVPAVTVRP